MNAFDWLVHQLRWLFWSMMFPQPVVILSFWLRNRPEWVYIVMTLFAIYCGAKFGDALEARAEYKRAKRNGWHQ